MKYFILFALVCLWCTGCTPYQYATISSSINQSSEGFVVENDTVKIAYAFDGENGPVKISIYNKLQTPLYVDWSKSALIINDNRTSYANKNSSLDAELNATQSRWMNSTTQTGTIQGTIKSQEASGFIPPRAWAKESQLSLNPEFLKLPAQPVKEMKRVKGVAVKSFSYSREQSPLAFRSFLTLSAHTDFSNPIHFDHEFWISEISQTQSLPRNFLTQPDRFYSKKHNNTAAYLVGAAAGVAAILFIVEAQETKRSLSD